MSYLSKTGKIIAVADHATHDIFASQVVVLVTLETEQGERVNMRYPIKLGCEVYYDVPAEDKARLTDGIKLYDYLELFPPAVGDTVRLGWDYSNFSGRILTVAPEPRTPISRELPLQGKSSNADLMLEDRGLMDANPMIATLIAMLGSRADE